MAIACVGRSVSTTKTSPRAVLPAQTAKLYSPVGRLTIVVQDAAKDSFFAAKVASRVRKFVPTEAWSASSILMLNVAALGTQKSPVTNAPVGNPESKDWSGRSRQGACHRPL